MAPESEGRNCLYLAEVTKLSRISSLTRRPAYTASERELSYQRGRKNFSHRRTNFPLRGMNGTGPVEEWTGKFQTNKVVSLGVRDSHGSSAQGARRTGQGCSTGQRRTGNLQQNLRRWRRRAPHSYQGAARANVQRGGKLKKLLAIFVPGTHENRNGQGKSHPLATFFFGLASNQVFP